MCSKAEWNSLETLSRLPDSEFVGGFCNSLSSILFGFRNDDENETYAFAMEIVDRFFKQADMHAADAKLINVLKEVAWTLVSYYAESIRILEDTSPTSKEEPKRERMQQRIFTILSCFDSLSLRLSGATEQLDMERVPNIPKCILTIMLRTFKHCSKMDEIRDTELSYDRDRDLLTELLKKCHQLQCHFFTLCGKLRIKVQFEEQLEWLVEMLNLAFDVGVVVISLDLKPMVQQWRGYTSLVEEYSYALKNHFDISATIKFLVQHITEEIPMVCSSANEDRVKLATKLWCFLLKNIIKLCECFSGCLGHCVRDLLEFVFLLSSRSCGVNGQVNLELVKKIENSVSPGLDALVTNLVTERQFIRYYLSLNFIKFKEDGRGTELLIVLLWIFRKLATCSGDTLRLWMETEGDLLQYVFKVVDQLDDLLLPDHDIPSIVLEYDTTGTQQVYDDLVIRFSSFILTKVDQNQFSYIESLLVRNLLKSNHNLGTLFTCDVWCTVARYGSADLRFEHTKFLIQIYDKVKHSRRRVIIGFLVKRLFSFLRSSHQLQIMSLLPFNELYSECYAALADETKIEITRNTVANCMSRFRELQCQQISPEPYIRKIQLVNVIVHLNREYVNEFCVSAVLALVTDTWKRVRNIQMNFEDFQLYVNTFASLCSATSAMISHLHSSEVLMILQTISILVGCDSVFLKLGCLRVIRELAHYQVQSQSGDICETVGKLFNKFLNDENSIVKQRSLETFSYFFHFTRNSEIMPIIISKDKVLKETICLYLKQQPQKQLQEKQWSWYVDVLSSKVRKIAVSPERRGRFKESSFEESVPKKIKLEYTVVDKLRQLQTDVLFVSNYVHSHNLTVEEKEMLNRTLVMLNKLRNFI